MRPFVLSGTAMLLLAFDSTATAEPPRRDVRIAAESLFYEARVLMGDGKYDLACPKLEESLRLDYGIGTEFNLADCNEHLGKLSSAWSGFLSVGAAARRHHQSQRERVAYDRAKALEPRLPKLSIDVHATAPGLEVRRNGVVVQPSSWGTPVPVDPGSHRITASAPGKVPWEATVSTYEGRVARISVPHDLPDAVSTVKPAVIPTRPAPLAPRKEPRPLASFPEPIVDERGSPQRTIGWILGGLGVAGLGVGAGFGIDSLQKRERSMDHCTGDICDARGVALRDNAIQSGDISTVATIGGAAALVGGIVLLLTAQSGSRREAPPTTALRAVSQIAGSGISLEGLGL